MWLSSSQLRAGRSLLRLWGPWCCFNLSSSFFYTFDWTAPPLGANICSQVPLIKQAESPGRDEVHERELSEGKVRDLLLSWSLAALPCINCPNDFQLFNFPFLLSNHANLLFLSFFFFAPSFVMPRGFFFFALFSLHTLAAPAHPRPSSSSGNVGGLITTFCFSLSLKQ